MMKVELISVTPNALELLLGTKSARMRGADPKTMTEQEKADHFKYMLDTIKSPFEFVDYVFDISGVSKNFTHQLVRTRTGAYQQETSRALEISAFDAVRPKAFEHLNPDQTVDVFSSNDEERINNLRAKQNRAELWDDGMATIDALYAELIAAGAELQDARGIMPSNMSTRIQAKFNLRTLSETAKTRLCTRTQGEYQEVFREMRRLILEVHWWAEPLLQVACVATGQCAFPRHGKAHCPFWRPWMDLEAEKAKLKQDFWNIEVQTNNPVANNGKSSG
ncbi:thymidylate synthase [Pantoea phage Kyle]|uniref:Thymidylate synthase n=1 Tax=Pantoea phage Kyle TaxID=2589665 RepID=A0A514A8V7_9CAUD|nr:thymidylate synthase [Pantoea phage Kyle]QDH49664.1 thymidylate synthase [Pantoea phage Kyle]